MRMHVYIIMEVYTQSKVHPVLMNEPSAHHLLVQCSMAYVSFTLDLTVTERVLAPGLHPYSNTKWVNLYKHMYVVKCRVYYTLQM